jgi:mono/diheme cytochrome c family protein
MLVLATAACIAGSMGFAQSSGEAVYKANCQSCHGSAGTPSPGIAKMMGVKAASDPDIKKLSAEEEFNSVKNGKGKMKPLSGKLTDAQIKDVVTYFRSLK